ncbi:hypothetical protein K501DRAFT_277808 [Backusella circina FSU 941]|nr:hypothetical protein K501DRAFT_277808 [Backusella circina FSU 941]
MNTRFISTSNYDMICRKKKKRYKSEQHLLRHLNLRQKWYCCDETLLLTHVLYNYSFHHENMDGNNVKFSGKTKNLSILSKNLVELFERFKKVTLKEKRGPVAERVINREFAENELDKRESAKRAFSSHHYMSDIETDSEDNDKYIRMWKIKD